MNDDPTRSPSGFNRRTALAGLGAGGLSLALATNAQQSAAQEATPAALAGHPLVGAWIVDRIPDDPTVGAAGVWEATGERTANYTLISIFAEGTGGYRLVRGSLEVDPAGEMATASYSRMVVAPDGTVLDQTAQATAHYLRLRLVPPDAELQPLAGFPAWTPAPPATPTA